MYRFKEKKIFIIVGFSTIFVCASLIWFYQLNPIITKAQTQASLKLEILTSQNQYFQLEPIPLRFKLLNQTAVPITWNAFLGIGPDINLIARAENGTETRWIGKNMSVDAPIMDTEIMQPGINKEEQNLIDESLAKKIFPSPGRYELRVEFVYRKYTNGQRQIETIVSNPVTVEIKSPLGINLLAYQYLNTQGLINGGGRLNEIIQAQQYFVNNFSNSVYWKYVTYDLAKIYMEQKDYVKAEREFYNISDLNFYYSEKVKLSLWNLAGKLNRPNPRSKRLPVPNIPPVSAPVMVPSAVPIPFPNNPPVLIPIPNPNTNSTPLSTGIQRN